MFVELSTTLREIENPGRDRCQSALWDCFGGWICRHIENASPKTVPQCTLTTISTRSPAQLQGGEFANKLQKILVNDKITALSVNKCLASTKSNVTKNDNELWKTVRLRGFQKPQLQSISIFFKFVHVLPDVFTLLFIASFDVFSAGYFFFVTLNFALHSSLNDAFQFLI